VADFVSFALKEDSSKEEMKRTDLLNLSVDFFNSVDGATVLLLVVRDVLVQVDEVH
jgi:hypothetical protein